MVKKAVIAILAALGLLIFIAIVVFCCYIWYWTFDVSGLEFYDDAEIKSMYFYGERTYITATDNKLFVCGEYSDTDSRTYRNSEFKNHKKLKAPSPVLIFEGNIKTVIPYSSLGAFIITEEAELYEAYDMTIKKVSDSVSFVCYDNSTGEKYIINIDGELLSLGNSTPITDNAVAASACQGTIYVLDNNGRLWQLDKINGVYEKQSCLYEGVKSFSVTDTSVRFDGDKYVYDDPEGLKNPLITVLTDEDEVYVKGAYNLISRMKTFAEEQPLPVYISDWTLLGKDVLSVSSAHMGTLIRYKNGSCDYYGFELKCKVDSRFGRFELPVKSSNFAQATELGLAISDSDGNWYFWGDIVNSFFIRYCGNHDESYLLADNPLIINLS